MQSIWTRMACALIFFVGFCTGSDAAPSIKPIPFKHAAGSPEQDLRGVLLGFGVCVVALGGALYFLRRKFPSPTRHAKNTRAITVIDTQKLNQRTTLYVVEFGTSQYLISQNEQGTQCLASSPASPLTAPEIKQ